MRNDRAFWLEQGRQAGEELGFSLPPGVTMRKEAGADGDIFYFRHRLLGEIGRVRIEARSVGSHLVCEVAGDPDDPMTAKRIEIMGPLGRSIGQVLDKAGENTYPGMKEMLPPSVGPTPSGSAVSGLVQHKFMQCSHCSAKVALLIFDLDAYGPDQIEDVSRKMFHFYKLHNLPTWIIGGVVKGDLAQSDPMHCRSQILQVWPVRGEILTTNPSEFNPSIQRLQDSHCDSR